MTPELPKQYFLPYLKTTILVNAMYILKAYLGAQLLLVVIVFPRYGAFNPITPVKL